MSTTRRSTRTQAKVEEPRQVTANQKETKKGAQKSHDSENVPRNTPNATNPKKEAPKKRAAPTHNQEAPKKEVPQTEAPKEETTQQEPAPQTIKKTTPPEKKRGNQPKGSAPTKETPSPAIEKAAPLTAAPMSDLIPAMKETAPAPDKKKRGSQSKGPAPNKATAPPNEKEVPLAAAPTKDSRAPVSPSASPECGSFLMMLTQKYVEAESEADRAERTQRFSESELTSMFSVKLQISGDSETTQAPAQRKDKKKKKDPRAPKHPLTGFMYYSMEQRSAVVEANPGLSFAEISAELGRSWKALPDSHKEKYLQMGQADRERYHSELEAYQQTLPPK